MLRLTDAPSVNSTANGHPSPPALLVHTPLSSPLCQVYKISTTDDHVENPKLVITSADLTATKATLGAAEQGLGVRTQKYTVFNMPLYKKYMMVVLQQ